MCLIGMAVAACTSIDCPVNNSVRACYALMKADGTPDTLKKDTMWVWTQRVDGTDTVISRKIQNNLELNYFYGPSASTFDLPVSYTQPEDVLCVLVRNAVGKKYLDTIRIKKENIPHFESVDCGPVFFHTITDVNSTNHLIQSVTINNSKVDYDASKTNIKIQYGSRD